MDRFTFLFYAPGGHSFFKDNKTDLIAIADDSGPTPDQTDDGVCFLDDTRPVKASGTGFYLPIICKKKQTHTIASPTEARMVCEQFDMKMSVDGVSFRLVASVS